MALNDLTCRHAKPKEKRYKLFDGAGLYLEITPAGSKSWRWKYRFFDKEKRLTLGSYPRVSILEARNRCEQARITLEKGIDPAAAKQEEKLLAKYRHAQTFKLVAEEWHTRNKSTWSERHAETKIQRLKANVFPHIGNIPIADLKIQQILVTLQKIEDRGAHELARRILQDCGKIFRYAVVTGRASRDITIELKGSLKKFKKGHYASIEIKDIPKLVKAINNNEARLFRQTTLAIKLLMLTFVRTIELIAAKKSEFDLKKKVWIIPAERMKMRIAHHVPLSKQSIEIIKEAIELSGRNEYLFPSVIKSNRHISNNTILKALERLGYHKIMTGHGFRSLAMSAIKEELGYRHEVVDRQLAHQPKTDNDKAYDRATFLAERKKMMQKWANYIDKQS